MLQHNPQIECAYQSCLDQLYVVKETLVRADKARVVELYSRTALAMLGGMEKMVLSEVPLDYDGAGLALGKSLYFCMSMKELCLSRQGYLQVI